MDIRIQNTALAVLATLCACSVGLIVTTIILTHGSQEYFQIAQPAASYAAYIQKPGALLGMRIGLGLDNLFLIFYSSFFVMLAVRLRGMLPPPVLAIGLTSILITTLLDMIENHHIMTTIHLIGSGQSLSETGSQMQMVASQVKFHCSYLAVFLFAFGYMQFGRLGRFIAVALLL